MSTDKTFITNVELERSNDKFRADENVTINVKFAVMGAFREAFNEKNWERAYNKHDNAFRMTIEVDLKSGRKTILPLKFSRKAVLFWTRSPKIPYRIWVSIIKDETPFYPMTVEEAKSLLFDVNKVIEVKCLSLENYLEY